MVIFVDRFPELSETFIVEEARALARVGHRVDIEAAVRAAGGNPLAAELPVRYWADETRAQRLRDLIGLVARHPLRSLCDLAARRRWRREEQVPPLRRIAPAARRADHDSGAHLHAHFAAGAALSALRISRLTGVPYSVTAHAYDIYLAPTNLREKLTRAAFATSGCDYTVRDLRALAGEPAAARIHRIVMGVDPERLRRSHPYGHGGHVVAVGRLVEKKGFGHLIEAVALMRSPVERVTIVGEGPLREPLARRINELGLNGVVELAGARSPAEVRDLLEDADLLAMPCVVAPDGDRDSMPVVVKEALAMEVPVVASDEVGLPEVMRPEWGRLVPPAEPVALAAAIDELLATPPEARAAMGRAGRRFVVERCNVGTEAQRLAELVAAARV